MGAKRKIPMDQRRETREQRSVSFTKRRQGLYKKAVELSLFCGAQVAIVMSSPCTSRNLYSFGHPSVDAVFDAFLEGRQPDDCGGGGGGEAGDGGVSRSVAVSLYEEVKALERGEPDEIRKRRRMKKSTESSEAEFWREFEVFEKSCESVEELEVLVENLENLKEKALNRLMMTTTTMTSDTTPPSTSSNLFNSAVNFFCLDDNRSTDVVDSGAAVIAACSNNNNNNNHQDANCNANGVESNQIDRVSTFDFINVDENNATETDSITAHILDSFALDDDCHNIEALFCPSYPDHHHQDHPSKPIDAPPVTRVSDFRHLINFI